jgi:DNA invertase Pin-like site-specific DNA recombinase
MSNKCVLYARVSTGAQADRQLSIPAQLEAMREFASNNGWKVANEYVESGVSGRTTERPALTSLLGSIRSKDPGVSILLVHKIDRLARNLADHVAIRSYLAKSGVRLVSMCEQVDQSTSGQLVENIMASLAEFYSANLSEEVRKGLGQRVKRGGWPHLQPVGYRRVASAGGSGSSIEPDPVKGPLVRKAFEAIAVGSQTAMAVREWLREQGWEVSRSAFSRILNNPFYCGLMRWKGETYRGNHAPLVSEETFGAAQSALKSRSRAREWGNGHECLHGVATCACGSLVSSRRHRRWTYYRCRRAAVGRGKCGSVFMNAQTVHASLMLLYARLPMTEAVRDSLRDHAASAERARDSAEEWWRDQTAAHRITLQAQELRLAEALASGLLEPELYRATLAKVRSEAAAASSATALKAPENAGPNSFIAEGAETVMDAHDTLDRDGQRALARAVFAKLSIDRTGVASYELLSNSRDASGLLQKCPTLSTGPELPTYRRVPR